ncbi:flagellar hook-associated family protein [Mangrovicella endophytica]|uniref:flagellar hook-associated family protein n=1 Tax=Mangrovicella endophytica TaxID=2066697 RepID=UPI000C9DB724|nr:flagellar hook-associated family protein [Mangrovicella endophytica]
MTISTLSMIQAQRMTAMKAQEQLRDAQTEAATSRYADVGKTLGYQTGQSVSFRVETTSIKSQVTTNGLIGQKLDSMQNVLDSIFKTAEAFKGNLIGAQQDKTSMAALVTEAKAGLDQLMSALNTATGGQYLFSGTNASTAPMKSSNYQDSDGQTAAAQSLSTFLAGPPTYTDLSEVPAADLDAYIDGAFSALFDTDPASPPTTGWTASWSSANDAATSNYINKTETIETSVSANLQAFKDLAKAYSMVATLGSEKLTSEAKTTLTIKATKTLAVGSLGITSIRTDLGLRQQRLESANDRLGAQQAVVERSIGKLEQIDPYEASTRVTLLLNQINASYAITAKIQQLSILNFI